MIKSLMLLSVLILTGCGKIDLLLLENHDQNNLRGNTSIVLKGDPVELFAEEVYSFFEDNQKGEYILITTISEKTENRLVKTNQVAEKINYEITVNYEVFYKSMSCNIFNKKIVSSFSFVPKSFGYNFGTDRSLEKLYRSSVVKNIENFAIVFPNSTNCIK